MRGNHAYMAGTTVSPNFPLVRALQPHYGGQEESFITLINFSPHLYFAQVGNGGGIASEILLANPSSENTATATIEFLAGDGSPMTLALSSPQGNFSSLEVTVPPPRLGEARDQWPGGRSGGSRARRLRCRFGRRGSLFDPGCGHCRSRRRSAFAAFMTTVRRTAINTGIAIHNVGEGQLSLRLSLRNTAGELLQGGQRNTQLAGRGHQAQFVDELH